MDPPPVKRLSVKRLGFTNRDDLEAHTPMDREVRELHTRLMTSLRDSVHCYDPEFDTEVLLVRGSRLEGLVSSGIWRLRYAGAGRGWNRNQAVGFASGSEWEADIERDLFYIPRIWSREAYHARRVARSAHVLWALRDHLLDDTIWAILILAFWRS